MRRDCRQEAGCRQRCSTGRADGAGARCTPLFLAGFATEFGVLSRPGHLVLRAGTLQREEGAGKCGGLAFSALALPPVPKSCFHLLF